MFSPTKLVGIAVVVAFMGTLAVAVPISHEVAKAPVDAAAQPTEISEVTGKVLILSEDDHGEAQTHDWGVAITDQLWTGKWDLDDDRLDGYGRALLNEWRIAFAGGPKSISMYIENDGGSWAGSGHAWSGVGKGGWHHRLVLEGQDGYDGLTAILSADQDYSAPTLEVSGVVFDGGLPPMPGAAPTELGTYGT